MLVRLNGAEITDSPSLDPRLRQLLLAMDIINDRLNWRWALTSFIRSDNRAHREGRAADFAARSGPLWAIRRTFSCPFYHRRPELKTACTDAIEEISEYCPAVHLILIEPDHLHIELTKHEVPRRIDVVTYAARPNELCPVIKPGQRIIRQLPITGDVHADEHKDSDPSGAGASSADGDGGRDTPTGTGRS